MEKETLLSVRDLSVWFELRRWGFGHAGFVRAVDGVSFDLIRGGAVAVVGESGCGKSTLARTVLGLHQPRKGEIVFDSRDLGRLKTGKRRWFRSQVGYIQQDPYGALAPFMTVQQILQEPLIINGVRDRRERAGRLNEVLEAVKLTRFRYALPLSLFTDR